MERHCWKLSYKAIATSMVLLGLTFCQKPVYHSIATSVQPIGCGTIVVTPSGESVLDGTSVTFRATPNGDYIFSGWSGSLSGTTNPATIVATSNLNIVANFQLRDYPLTLSVEGEGSIEERVISTKTEYTSGTVVELTATPTIGWSFDHWEGDLTGNENPIQITITSAKSVKAVFFQKVYDYTLRIIGPGVVNEQIAPEVKGYMSGTRIQLTAVPSNTEGSRFVGWGGHASGTEPTIVVDLSETKTIIATFENVFDNPEITPRQPDLTKVSRFNPRLFFGEDFSAYTKSPYKFCYLDYNMDGVTDIITTNASGEWNVMNWTPDPIGFYLGRADGSFYIDEINSGKFEGLIGTRKIIYGDYNSDGFPDVFIIAGGYDFPPFPGEYCVLLLSDGSGSFSETRFTDEPGHFHGGASGDLDNDGDLDIVTTQGYHPVFFINDGTGHFSISKEWIDYDCERMFNGELYDINKDGFLDFICGGHSWEGPEDSEEKEGIYNNDPLIFWGDGVSFEKARSTRLPKCAVDGFGLVCDFLFYDLDDDGKEEILVSRTGDGAIQGGPAYYGGWNIQVLKEGSAKTYYDATSSFIGVNDSYEFHPEYQSWIVWLDVEEINKEMYLLGAFDMGSPNAFRLMRISNGKLSRIPPSSSEDYTTGFPIFSDTFEGQESMNGGGVSVDCTDNPKEGQKCIKWVSKAAWGQELVCDFETQIDMTSLVKDGYEMEFYVRNTNPKLTFFVNLKSSREEGKEDCVFHEVSFPQENCDGQWHRIHVPLSRFSPSSDSEVWSKIQSFTVVINSEGTEGSEFYLDEIRIRKVLPE